MAKFNLIYVWRTLRIDPLGNLLFMNNLSGLRNSLKLAMGYFKKYGSSNLVFSTSSPTSSVELLYHIIHLEVKLIETKKAGFVKKVKNAFTNNSYVYKCMH